MNTVERMQYDAVIEERDELRRECVRLQAENTTLLARVRAERAAAEEAIEQLAAAEALNAEAAAAGPIVDQRIKELDAELASAQQAIKTYIAGLSVLSAERDRYKRKLADMQDDAVAAYIDHADGMAACIEERRLEPQPSETELERRAWELFARAAGGGGDLSATDSFWTAARWIACRDERRKAGDT